MAVAAAVGAAAAAVLVAALVVGRAGASRPDPVASAYLTAWRAGDYPAMAADVDRPPADFASVHRQAAVALAVQAGTYVLGSVSRRGALATAPFHARLTLRGLGTWEYDGSLHLQRRNGRWLVEWSPQSIHPALGAGDRFVRQRSWPARAPILGAGGVVLAGPVDVVSIGLEGGRIKDPAAVTAALTAAGADPAAVQSALAQAAAHPDQFTAVFEVPRSRFAQLDPTLRPLPGVLFRAQPGRAAATPDLAAHVVGSVAPATAEELTRLGSPYQAGDVVGQGGIEAVAERRLAGSPGGTVTIVDATGREIATVFTVAARPGAPVVTSIDLATEQSAEHALDGVGQPAALVAIRPSTGEVLAAVSRPVATPFDRALEGRYPPGSTFKVVTGAALLASGLTPASPASCPPTLVIDGRSFRNFEGEAQATLPLHRAFAISCNTAFLGLAARLGPDALIHAADGFGFGRDPALGLPAFGGRIPAPADAVERAASAIGQGRVTASPLQLAAVAAAVADGSFRSPRLVAGAPDDASPPTPLDPGVVAGLRSMMAEVVASGSGTAAAVPGGQVFGKTGTAEFGNANPPSTHAWFIGWRGDTAFAVLVEGGGVGGQVAAPIAARFLRALLPS